MADWRKRGYVPDSDEEDDDDDASLLSSQRNGQESQSPRNDGLGPGSSQDSLPPPPEAAVHTSSKLPASSLILGGISSPGATQKADVDLPSPTQIRQVLPQVVEEAPELQQSSPVAEQLELELQRGLEACRDILQHPPVPQSNGSDSPLSSLPSSPSGSLFQSPRSSTLPASPARLLLPSSALPPVSVEDTVIRDGPLPAAVQLLRDGPVRSLRQRAPLQLHPYSLEAAKYQREWQQRGLRPVRTNFAPDLQQRVTENREESQGTATFSSSDVSSEPVSFPAHSRPLGEDDEFQSPLRKHPPTQGCISVEEKIDDEEVHTDDELPDINDLFRKDGEARSGPHRQRNNGHPHIADRLEAGSDLLSRSKASDAQPASVFDLPPSPPRSRSISSSTDMHIDNTSMKTTPRPLPTPVISSEMKPTKRRIIDVSSSSDDEPSEIDTENSGPTEVPAFMQMRKRIKGVLPASWIKLDARQQKRQPDRQALSRSPEKRPAKGVARHVSPRLTSPSGRSQFQWDYSSESEDSGENKAQVPPHRQKQSDIRSLLDQVDGDVTMDDVFENDTIDHMAPAGSKRTALKHHKTRQQRLGESWDMPGTSSRKTGAGKTGRSIAHPKSSGFSRPRVKKRKTSKQIELSILDAPGLVRFDHTRQPRDLRVAARSTKSARLPRPQNPTRKFFQLDTAGDTADVKSTLHDWRARRIVHSMHQSTNNAVAQRTLRDPQKSAMRPVPSPRQRLREESKHNGQTDSAPRGQPDRVSLAAQSLRRPHRISNAPQHGNHADTVRFLKASTESTLARVRASPLTDESSTSTNANHTSGAHLRSIPGFISWHQNRAGGGTFWNNTIGSRPTQLEVAATSPCPHRRIPRSTPSGYQHRSIVETRSTMPLAKSPTTILPSKPKKPSQPQHRKHHQAQNNSDQDNTVMAGLQAAAMYATNSVVTASDGVLDPTLAHRLGSTPSIISPFPRDGTRLQLSDFISSGQLLNAMLFMAPSTGPQRSSSMILAFNEVPETERMMNLPTKDQPESGFVEGMLYEAIDAAINNPRTADWDYVLACLCLMNEYVTMILSQNRTTEIQTLFPRLLDFLDVHFSHPQQFLLPLRRDLASLHVFVRLLVLCYLTCDADGKLSGSEHLQTSYSVYERGMTALVQFLLKPEFINVLIDFGTSQGISLSQNVWPVVEAWIVIFTSISSPALRDKRIDFDNMLLQYYNAANPKSEGRQLPTALLLIPGLELVSRLDAGGVFHTAPNVQIDSWSILGPALKDFFGQSIDQSTEDNLVSITVCMVGMSAVRLCLWLAENCAWNIPDALLQIMFKRYGKNDMLELFVPPSISTAASRISSARNPIIEASKLTDFDIFLRLVTLKLERKSADVVGSTNNVLHKNKLLGLVFSLTPNNSRTMDEHEAIEETVYVTMANTYALYTVLYAGAPLDCRPRLSQIQNLVDFPTSHACIRDLTISAWSNMTNIAIEKGATPEDHKALGEQGKVMWSALLEKITLALRFEIRPESTFHHQVVVNNCRPVLVQLTGIIKQWTLLVGVSTDMQDIEPYLSPTEVVDMVQITVTLRDYLQRLSTSSRDAFVAMSTLCGTLGLDLAALEMLRAVYFRRLPSLRDQAYRSARELISGILSSNYEDDSRLQTVVDIWFSMAKLDVGKDLSRWDQYLQPPSPSALRMIADTQTSQQCCVLFLSRLVADCPDCFELDPDLLYQSWIIAILQADTDLRFEHILTDQIISKNPSTLDLTSLDTLIKKETGKGERLTLSTFKSLRTTIVKYLIRSIFNLQFVGPDDSQDLIEEPVDEASGRRLLQIINDTMRKIWLRLSLEQRNEGYTSLVQAVVQEIEIYKYPGFRLDAWYTDPQRTEFPVAGDWFKQLFRHIPGGSGRLLDNTLIIAFHRQNQKAANTRDQDQWVKSVVEALSCNDILDDVNTDGSLVMNGALQISFIQNVLSVYIQSAFLKGPRHAVWTIPVAHVLVEVLRKLHFRQDLQDEGRVEELSNMCLQLLISCHQALEVLARHDMAREHHILMFAALLVDLATCSIERLHQFRLLHPGIDALYVLLEPISLSAQAIFDCVTGATFVTLLDRTTGQEAATIGFPAGFSMRHTPPSRPVLPVHGTDPELRQLTLNNIDEARNRGRKPVGLGEDWSFWHDGHCQSVTGWEEHLDGGELSALARSVKEFCGAAARGADVIVDGEWRKWENLARFGSRSAPFVSSQEVEEEHVVEEWEDE